MPNKSKSKVRHSTELEWRWYSLVMGKVFQVHARCKAFSVFKTRATAAATAVGWHNEKVSLIALQISIMIPHLVHTPPQASKTSLLLFYNEIHMHTLIAWSLSGLMARQLHSLFVHLRRRDEVQRLEITTKTSDFLHKH